VALPAQVRLERHVRQILPPISAVASHGGILVVMPHAHVAIMNVSVSDPTADRCACAASTAAGTAPAVRDEETRQKYARNGDVQALDLVLCSCEWGGGGSGGCRGVPVWMCRGCVCLRLDCALVHGF
jgi:hypothetical protein